MTRVDNDIMDNQSLALSIEAVIDGTPVEVITSLIRALGSYKNPRARCIDLRLLIFLAQFFLSCFCNVFCPHINTPTRTMSATSFSVGIIGMGDMGRMYASCLSLAGWR